MPKRVSRRKFIRDGVSATLGFAALPLSRIQPVSSFDIVICGATLVDGTGGPLWKADLGLIGDEIAAIDGIIAPEQGKKVLDGSGLYLSAGFIDIHTHSDDSILRYPTADSRIRQGITTEITGNCGYSVAPLGAGGDEQTEDLEKDYGIKVNWTDVGSYLAALDQTGISVNHALLIGHGTLRVNAIGAEARPLSSEETKRMQQSLEESMDHGAFGLSTGLEYVPGRFTPTEEIVALTRVVARRGGLYASHIRNEESTLLEAVNEAIQIGRLTGARVEVSHLKAAGEPNWGKQQAALDLIASARRSGVPALADAYPYTAYSTGLTIFMPAWAMDGGYPALAKRLEEPSDRSRIRDELISRVKEDPGDYDLIVISSLRTQTNQPLIGENLAQIGEKWGMEPIDALLRLVVEEQGAVGFIGHGMSSDNVEKVLSHPLVMVGSDGGSMAPEGPAAKTRPHPRSYGTCARVLGHYCRERQIFDWSTAVKKMTSMPADQVGIRDRGRIARGKKADLVLFDPETVADGATFEDPHRYPTGIHHVIVNGKSVVENGRHTGAKPGQALRKA